MHRFKGEESSSGIQGANAHHTSQLKFQKNSILIVIKKQGLEKSVAIEVKGTILNI